MMKTIDRRSFLKVLGVAGSTSAGLAMGSCGKHSGGQKYDVNGTETSPVPVDKMTYRTNPGSGDRVSLLGYGCMRWPMIDNPEGQGQIVDQEMVNSLVDFAIEHGVNYFDTAPVYCQGFSEKATGIALGRHPRSSYFVATKMSNQRLTVPGKSPEQILQESKAMFQASLENLGVDYLDYYLMHSIGGGAEPMAFFEQRFITSGVLDYMVDLKKQGKIRNLGWSFHGDVNVFNHLLQLHDEGKYHWDFVQIQMNYSDWRNAQGRNVNAEYLYTELTKRNIPVVIMEPLLGGRLVNLPDFIVGRLKQMEPEKSTASWSFRFNGSYDNVLTSLSGMTYMENLQDNVRTHSPLKPLSEEEADFLQDTAVMMLEFPTVPCNSCNYCMPCPYGLDIPGILVHYNKCVNYGNLPRSMADPGYSESRRIFLFGYDNSVPKLRQADHCTGCSQCVEHCPQGIDIPGQLHRIDKYVDMLKQNTLTDDAMGVNQVRQGFQNQNVKPRKQ